MYLFRYIFENGSQDDINKALNIVDANEVVEDIMYHAWIIDDDAINRMPLFYSTFKILLNNVSDKTISSLVIQESPYISDVFPILYANVVERNIVISFENLMSMSNCDKVQQLIINNKINDDFLSYDENISFKSYPIGLCWKLFVFNT